MSGNLESKVQPSFAKCMWIVFAGMIKYYFQKDTYGELIGVIKELACCLYGLILPLIMLLIAPVSLPFFAWCIKEDHKRQKRQAEEDE